MCLGGGAPAPPPPPPLPPAPPPPLPPKMKPSATGGGKTGAGPNLTINPSVKSDPNKNVNTGPQGPAGGLNI